MNQICDEHVIKLLANAYRVGWIAAQGGIGHARVRDETHRQAQDFAREQLKVWKQDDSNADCRENFVLR